MRPRYLEVEGLQSFKDAQAIDFDKLSEMGLFGIFGPTGSGKSTILDAITLALYGNVQRAARGTQGIINTSMNDMRVLLAFDLQKEGKRKTYKVERIYKRKKDSDTSIESKLTRFFEIVEGKEHIIADKLGEVNASIIDLIGLQFDDFTRSVVLPQNKFQEFLLSPKAEKTKMLERIFYLEEYGRQLNDKLGRKLSSTRTRHSMLEGAISVLGEASHEALIAAQNRMKEAQELKNIINDKLKQAEEKYQAAKEARELILQLNELLVIEQKHIVRQGEIAAKKNAYERAIKANSLREIIASYREVEKNLEEAEVLLKETKFKLELLEAELSDAAEEYELKTGILRTKLPVLIEYKTKLISAVSTKEELDKASQRLKQLRESYTNEKAMLDSHDKRIADIKTKTEEMTARIAANKKSIEDMKINPEHRKAVQNIINMLKELDNTRVAKSEHNQKHHELAEIVVLLQNQLDELQCKKTLAANKLTSSRDALAKLEAHDPALGDKYCISEEEYYKIRAIVDILQHKHKHILEIKVRCKTLEEEINKIAESKKRCEEEKQSLQSSIDSIIFKIEGINGTAENFSAYSIAKTLMSGEPCPVCGSTEHPAPAKEVLLPGEDKESHNLNLLQAEKKELEKKQTALQNECIRLEANESSIINGIKQIESDLRLQKEIYEDKKGELSEGLKDLPLDKLEVHLEEVKYNNESIKVHIKAWEQEKDQLKKHIADLEAEAGEEKIIEGSLKAQLEVNQNTMSQISKQLNAISLNLDEKEADYSNRLMSIGIIDPHEEVHRIDECDHKIDLLQKEIDKLQYDQQQQRIMLDKLVEQRGETTSKLTEIEAEGRSLKQQKEADEKKLLALVGSKDIADELRNAEADILRYQQEEKSAADRLTLKRESYNTTSASLKSIENQRYIFANKHEAEGKRIEKVLRDNDFTAINQAEELFMDFEKLEALNKDIKEYEEIKQNIDIKKKMLEQRLNGRHITEDEWKEISLEYESALAEKETSISSFESARSCYESIKLNYEKWLKLNKEFIKVKHKKEMLEQIQKLLKGNSFIEFISEERLRYIAREASDTLGALTKHRYGLEIDTENGFVVRDNANGGVLRLVSSLSGGETFLTSLSLALALSSQLQLKGQSPLEFFFLDEGFGTLDNSLLDIVIDSLERLSSTKRVIGLISHVPELKSRISRRLVVEPPSRDGIGSKICIEKA